MKLVLKGVSAPETAKTLNRAFRVTTKALGIANFAAEVHCQVKPGKAEVSNFATPQGYFQRVDAEMGQTLDRLVGNVAKMQLFSFNTPQLIETFIHELVHVAQMLRGDLKRVRGVSVWKGRQYREPQSYDEYKRLPWEVEAEAYALNISRRLV
jgi:hypothetical protein